MTMTDRSENDDTNLKKRWGPKRIVDIPKTSDSSLGLSLVGGKVEVIDVHGNISEDTHGVFIKHIDADSPSGANGYLKIGDHILEINGMCVRDSPYDTAIEAIRSAENSIRLIVQSFTFSEDTSTTNVEVETLSDLQQIPVMNNAASIDIKRSFSNIEEKNASPGLKNPTKSYSIKSSNPLLQSHRQEDENTESSGSEDERHLEGNIRTKAGIEISRKSAGNIKRSSAEIAADPESEDEFGYTLQKIKKKYDHIGTEVILLEHHKNGRDIGLALSGHKDRVKMGVFICGLNSKRMADSSENFHIGDEILEVNGIVFENRCHLNACSMIKKMPSTILKMVIHRHTAIDKSAIRTTNYFPPRIDDKDQFAQFPDVRTITILKGQHGLGIMIIKGKHANVGQGIFASDIQEGSVAEKAGLQVGDMILGVNDDALLDSTYDEATNLLKAAEGLVILTVCSPNKNKKDELNTPSEESVAPKISAEVSSKTSSVNSHMPESSGKTDEHQEMKSLNEKKVEVKPITTELSISLDNGVNFLLSGGCDTFSGGVFINDLYSNNIGTTSVPLKCGDQILDFGTENFRHLDQQKVQTALLTTTGSVKITFLRDETAKEECEVELQKKLGKGLGISVTEFKNGKGVFISDLSSGGGALESEKLAVGDHILSICGRDVRELSADEIATFLKLFSPVLFKVVRYKTKQMTTASQ